MIRSSRTRVLAIVSLVTLVRSILAWQRNPLAIAGGICREDHFHLGAEITGYTSKKPQFGDSSDLKSKPQ